MSRTVLKVEGMTCGHCVQAVTSALRQAEGVSDAQVDLQAGRATVEYDEARTQPQTLAGVVSEQGYQAAVAS